MRTRQKCVATDTWRSLGCRTTPLEHWSRRKPTVEPHFDLYQSLNRLPIWNSQNCSMFPLAFVAEWLQGHWWGFISRNYVVWPTFFLMNVFIALKGSHFWFYICVKQFLLFKYPGSFRLFFFNTMQSLIRETNYCVEVLRLFDTFQVISGVVSNLSTVFLVFTST